MQINDDYRKEIFITITWFLWNHRDASRVGRPTQPLHKITQMAGSLLQEFLNTQEPTTVIPEPPTIQHWCPFDVYIFKANFGAACLIQKIWLASAS